MDTSQLVGIAFFAPLMVVAFGYVGYHFYKQNNSTKRPMATFNKR